jgi:hypothetical protein
MEPIPGFRPLELGDKPVFDEFFRRFPPEISEYTFTNLYMWRNYYHFAWQQCNNQLLLVALKKPEIIMGFPPVGTDPIGSINQYLEIARIVGKPLELHRVPESLKKIIEDSPIKCEIVEDPNNWDYIYTRESLVSLAGGDLFNERKKLNRFNRRYAASYVPLDAQNLPECVGMQEMWCTEVHDCFEDISLEEENKAIIDCLKHWETLKFHGGLLKVDEKTIAFTLGEPLTSDTFVVHIEKAYPAFDGSYQAINQQFVQNAMQNFAFVNREQDIGDPGLRRAKQNYHPVKMGKKWLIRF